MAAATAGSTTGAAHEMVAAMRSICGDAHVLTDRDLVEGHVVDWTRRFRGSTPAVVRPGSVDEVAAIVRWCAGAGVAIVPQGGNTGLVGGSVPLAGEVVLSTTRLRSPDVAIDVAAGQATVGAGIALARLQHDASRAGLSFGVDLGARDTATVGGMIATNAGGLHVVRHGSMRRQIIGVEAVLGDGSIVSRLTGVEKDNTGYDLAGLLCGSEGTLGIVTAARVRLVPAPGPLVTAIVGFPSVDAALDGYVELRRRVTLRAAEVMRADGIELVCRLAGLAPPLLPVPPVLVLVEWEGDDPSALGVLGGAADAAAVATDPVRAAGLWRFRDAHTEAVSTLGVPHKLDVTVPLGRLAAFVDEVTHLTKAHRLVLFGHLGDGNLHVNVVGPDADDETIDDAVLRLVVSLGGSISAEHGIGTAKKRWLALDRSAAEIAAFRAVKRALDPAGILNPNVLLPG